MARCHLAGPRLAGPARTSRGLLEVLVNTVTHRCCSPAPVSPPRCSGPQCAGPTAHPLPGARPGPPRHRLQGWGDAGRHPSPTPCHRGRLSTIPCATQLGRVGTLSLCPSHNTSSWEMLLGGPHGVEEGDLGALLLAKAAGKGRQPGWDSQRDQCRFPARRCGAGRGGMGSCCCSVPAPTPAQPHGGPQGAGWAACPSPRGPRDITAQARRAASADRGRGPGWGGRGGPAAAGAGRCMGGTLCTPAGLGGSQGTWGRGAGVHTPRAHTTHACTGAFTRVCACSACAQAARVPPHRRLQGTPAPPRMQGAQPAPPGTPGAPHMAALQPGHAGAGARTCVHVGCVLGVHTRVQGPRGRCGVEGGFGERWGAGGSAVGPGWAEATAGQGVG